MATAPKIPMEPSRFADTDEASADASLPTDGATEVPPSPDDGSDPKPHNHYGSLKQNLTTHWRVEER